MFKKLISVALATCFLITPMSSFANNNTNLSEGVQPFVGGGDSHVWFKYGSYSKILSRNDLVELKKILRNEADRQEQMSALVGFLSSNFTYGWMLGGGSLLDSAARNTQYKIEDELDLNPGASSYKVSHDEYRSEVPKTMYINITSVNKYKN